MYVAHVEQKRVHLKNRRYVRGLGSGALDKPVHCREVVRVDQQIIIVAFLVLVARQSLPWIVLAARPLPCVCESVRRRDIDVS